MAATGLISLAEWCTGEHPCMGPETEKEKHNKERHQNYRYHALCVQHFVCGRCLCGGEDVHYGWNGEEDKDDHHKR